MIVHATVKDSEKFKHYSESAGPTLKLFSAEILFKGKVAEVLTGDHLHEISAVMKFPDHKTIDNWYNSKEYQELIPLRESAADVVFIAIQE